MLSRRSEGKSSDSTEWEFVVKFTWPSDKRQQEGELLKLAKERGVTGIAVWFKHEAIYNGGDPDTISHFRRDMKFGKPHILPSKASWVDSSPETTRTSSTLSFRGRSGSGATGPMTPLTGQKRKRDEELDGGSRPKRPKSDGSYASGTSAHIKDELDAIGDNRIQEPSVDSLATRRTEWELSNVDSTQAKANSLTDCESDTYGDRVNYCLVTSPAGWPLHEYQSVRELLEVLRDAIRGHRSLFEVGKILYRDVSENDIIITEHPTKQAPKGLLIDLDLAKEVDSKPSGARHRTSTIQFMAIEVLEGEGHTYRHDLESFYYIFLWMCTRYSYEGWTRQIKLMRSNILRGWYTGTY